MTNRTRAVWSWNSYEKLIQFRNEQWLPFIKFWRSLRFYVIQHPRCWIKKIQKLNYVSLITTFSFNSIQQQIKDHWDAVVYSNPSSIISETQMNVPRKPWSLTYGTKDLADGTAVHDYLLSRLVCYQVALSACNWIHYESFPIWAELVSLTNSIFAINICWFLKYIDWKNRKWQGWNAHISKCKLRCRKINVGSDFWFLLVIGLRQGIESWSTRMN